MTSFLALIRKPMSTDPQQEKNPWKQGPDLESGTWMGLTASSNWPSKRNFPWKHWRKFYIYDWIGLSLDHLKKCHFILKVSVCAIWRFFLQTYFWEKINKTKRRNFDSTWFHLQPWTLGWNTSTSPALSRSRRSRKDSIEEGFYRRRLYFVLSPVWPKHFIRIPMEDLHFKNDARRLVDRTDKKENGFVVCWAFTLTDCCRKIVTMTWISLDHHHGVSKKRLFQQHHISREWTLSLKCTCGFTSRQISQISERLYTSKFDEFPIPEKNLWKLRMLGKCEQIRISIKADLV